MTMSNVLTASVLGLMSFSGAVASRDLTQAQSRFGGSAGTSGGKSKTCEKFPDLPHCQEHPPPPSPGPNVSSAHCSAVAWGYSEATNKDQSAQAAADAHAFICGDGSAEAHAIAQASARAFARAVAAASVSGEVSGTGSCWADAHSNAQAEASVWLDVYAEAFASSADCKHCEAWAESWAYVREHVFLSAQASAKATLDLYANGGNVAKHVSDYAHDIEEAIVTAYAEALAGTATYYNTNACWAWTGVEGCIISEDNPDGTCASCEASAVGDTFIQEIDAIATASASASAAACGDEVLSYASVTATATAIAEALAIATAQSYVSCHTDEGGYACGDASAYATDTAKAVAKAFASSWADAVSCDNCYVDVDAATESIGSVLVTAATSAYSHVCADNGSSWTVHDYQQHIEHEHLAAIAEACALALSVDIGGGGICLAAVTAGTYVGPV